MYCSLGGLRITPVVRQMIPKDLEVEFGATLYVCKRGECVLRPDQVLNDLTNWNREALKCSRLWRPLGTR